MSHTTPAESFFHELEAMVATLSSDDGRFRAFGSAVDNCEDTVREGGVERYSAEYYDLFRSSYGCSLEDVS